MTDAVGFDLSYAFGATTLVGYCALGEPGGNDRPGVLIAPDAFGLDAHCIGVADRLAAMGYAALAIDLWGERRQFELSDPELGTTLSALLGDRAEWMGRVEAARAALAAQPGVDAARIAGIGYCLGGSTMLEYARGGGGIIAVGSFHGGLDLVGREWERSIVRAKLLVCTGAEDPLVPWDVLTTFQEDVRKGGVNWEIDVYGGALHSFTRPDAAARSNPERTRYDPQADRRSWRAMADFLRETLIDQPAD